MRYLHPPLFAVVLLVSALHAEEPSQELPGPPTPAQGDVAMLAGGTVELRLPAGWEAREWTRQREVWLMVAPADGSASFDRATAAVWLAHHRSILAGSFTREVVRRRARELAPEVLSWRSEARLIHLPADTGSVRGIEQPFEFSSQEARLVGGHALATTPWGLLEMHWRCLAAQAHDFERDVVALMHSIQIHEPREVPGDEPLWGAWKSHGGQMRFFADGRVRVHFDRPVGYRIDEGHVALSRPTRQLTGSYRVDGDLIRVTWDDGSRLNYRYRLYQGHLLMTDNWGRTSELNPLFAW